MKKVLFATTALVASAGIASAEIELSGLAQMGVFGAGEDSAALGVSGVNNDGSLQFYNDFNITFTLTGETDSGLTFGADIDLDDDGAENNIASDPGDATVFISGAFGTLTMGDTDGAMDWAITETTGNPGSIDDSETLHAGYLGSFGDGIADGQIARYDYSFGDFAFAVSAELADGGEDASGDDFENTYALGLRYNADLGGFGLNLGLAYQAGETIDANYAPGNLGAYFGGLIPESTDVEIIAASVSTEFGGGFSAGLSYSDWSFDDDATIDEQVTQMQLSLGYTMDALSIGVNYGQYEFDDLDATVSGYGIAAAYDLGGGATLHAAYGDSDVDDVIAGADSLETYSFGLSFAF